MIVNITVYTLQDYTDEFMLGIITLSPGVCAHGHIWWILIIPISSLSKKTRFERNENRVLCGEPRNKVGACPIRVRQLYSMLPTRTVRNYWNKCNSNIFILYWIDLDNYNSYTLLTFLHLPNRLAAGDLWWLKDRTIYFWICMSSFGYSNRLEYRVVELAY